MADDLDYIAYFAKTKKFNVKPYTIFVEGTTDVRLFELAAKLEKEKTGFDLLGESLAIVASGEGDEGGAKGVCRELISFKNMARNCLLPNGRPKYRFVGLFDNDNAGRQAISDIRKSDISILEFKDVYRLWPVMPRVSNLDVDAIRKSFESENEKYKKLDWELEDLLPNSFSEAIVSENPNTLIRSYSMHDKVHRDWTSDGKAKLNRLTIQHAIYEDLQTVIQVLYAFWRYLNIKPPKKEGDLLRDEKKISLPFGVVSTDESSIKHHSFNNLTHRSFLNEQDKQLMIDLAGQFQKDHLHVVDLPYRLSSWGLDEKENVRLWFDGEKLVAWAVLQSPFWAIDYACHADHPALFKEILDWADGRAQAVMGTPYERSAWFVNVFSGQESRKKDLEGMGFACQSDVGEDSWSKVFMKLSPEPKLYEPPAGFTVRPLGGDVEKYVALHQSVFESKNMTLKWRGRTLQSPLYRPELDLVVESSTGELAAFCICWFNEKLSAGQVEPLGVHAEYRQLGLGKVALSHGVSRLRSMGAKDIFVETDNYRNEAFNLYQSIGFEVIQDVLVYRKDY